MNTARITATQDISDAVLTDLQSSLEHDLSIGVDPNIGRICQLSRVPPSWISVIVQSEWWIQALGVYAAVFVAEIVKEAAKETWKSKGKIAIAVARTGNNLFRLASMLFKAKSASRSDTEIVIGFPVSDGVEALLCIKQATTEEVLALEIALFVHRVPELVRLLTKADIPGSLAIDRVFLKVLPDRALQVEWMNDETGERVKHIIPLQ